MCTWPHHLSVITAKRWGVPWSNTRQPSHFQGRCNIKRSCPYFFGEKASRSSFPCSSLCIYCTGFIIQGAFAFLEAELIVNMATKKVEQALQIYKQPGELITRMKSNRHKKKTFWELLKKAITLPNIVPEYQGQQTTMAVFLKLQAPYIPCCFIFWSHFVIRYQTLLIIKSYPTEKVYLFIEF